MITLPFKKFQVSHFIKMENLERRERREKQRPSIDHRSDQFWETGGGSGNESYTYIAMRSIGDRVRGKAQGGKRRVATLRQLSCTRQPVRVVASPRASRLFAKFVFTIVDDVFIFDRDLVVLTRRSNRTTDSPRCDQFGTSGSVRDHRSYRLFRRPCDERDAYLRYEFIMEIPAFFHRA